MAFTSVSMTSFDAKLKNWYIDRKKLYLMDGYKTPLFNAINKKTDAAGKQWNVAVGASSIVGGGGTYANSWANASAGSDVNFYGSYKDRFGHGFIDDKVIRASKNADGAVEPALEEKIAQVRDQFIQGTEYQLFRDEGGGIGKVSTFTAGGVGGTVVLSANTALTCGQRLRKDMILDFSANTDGTSLRSTIWKVTNVQPSQFTISPYSSSGSDIPVASDTIYIDGDATKALCGLGSWVPDTEANVGSFKNVDRSTDTRALGGIRLDATGLRMTEALIQAGDTAMRYGANSSMVFVNPANYSALKQELSSKAEYEMVKGSPGVPGGTKGMSAKDATRFGFRALVLDGSQGQILVVASWACPLATSYSVELDSFWLETIGAWPSLKDLDGGPRMLRLTDGTNNAYVHELVGYGEALCSAPGHQVRIIHSTAA